MNVKSVAKKLLNGSSFGKWSYVKTSAYKRIKVYTILEILNRVSGNDVSEMLKDILEYENKNLNEKYYLALKNIGTMYSTNKVEKNFKPFVKRKIIKQIRSAGLKRSESIAMGFNCSKYLWACCLSEKIPEKRGRKRVNEDLVSSIQQHLESLSVIVSNRSIKSSFKESNNLKLDVPVYYRTKSLKEIYDSFPFKNEISFTSFFSYMNNQFKKPYRFNDLCQFCEYGKNLKKKLSGIAIQKGFVLVGAKEDIISEFRQYLENSKNQKYNFINANVKEFDRSFRDLT